MRIENAELKDLMGSPNWKDFTNREGPSGSNVVLLSEGIAGQGGHTRGVDFDLGSPQYS